MQGDKKTVIVWRPRSKPQLALVQCPLPEVFFGGARGGGKTDGVLGKWAIKERIYGKSFNAIMFRRTTVSSEDAIERSKELYKPLGGKFNETKLIWRMPNGGRVAFAYLDSVRDADEYQGRNVTDAWIEEAGQYPYATPIDRLFGVMRSASGVPVQMILTANPGGAGQHWISARYGLIPFPKSPKVVTRPLSNGSAHKMAVIPSRITDNRVLLDSDPGYIDRLHLVGSEALVRAWLDGDWAAIEGAFFDKWSPRNIVAPFEIPSDWTRFRSADWGYAKPFSVGWWAIASDDRNGVPRGSIVRYREWYGSNGTPNVGLRLDAEQVAEGIKEREQGETIAYGVLDPAAFAEDGGPSIAERMMQRGVYWKHADNKRVGRAGAVGGWDMMRARISGEDGVPRLFVFDTCRDFIRTVPVLQHDVLRAEDLDCWVAGTMISTPIGDRPIENVLAGDIVDTPIGPRPVLRSYLSGAGETVLVRLSDGRTLQGTARHKIHIKNIGLVKLGDVDVGMVLTERIIWQRSLSTAVRFTVAMRVAATTILAAAELACTVRHGLMLGEKYRVVGMSTTSITTMTTTISRISNAFLLESMKDITSRNASTASLASSLLNGGLPKKVRRFFATMPERCERELASGNVRAEIVAVLSLQNTLARSFAVANALRRGICRFFYPVRFAGSHSTLSATQRSKSEPVRIVAVGRCEGATPVYNLTVAGAHLFYANGFLSSNTESEDHVADECFAAGTIVETLLGACAIEKLPPTGYVVTDVGMRRYEHPRLTRENAALVRLTFDNGLVVNCTDNHAFMVGSPDEWRYAKDLEGMDVTCARSSLVKLCRSSTAFVITVAVITFSARALGYIAEYGRRLTALSSRGCTSTISTAIERTTLLRTWKQLQSQIILAGGTAKQTPPMGCSVSPKQMKLLEYGMGAKRGEIGIATTMSEDSGRSWSGEFLRYAKNAAKSTWSRLLMPIMGSSATRTAKRVRCVSVERLQERADVYCLSVPGVERFAIESGLIVHNCRYACMSRPWTAAPKATAKTPRDRYNRREEEGAESWKTV